jgi:hypothetical protein
MLWLMRDNLTLNVLMLLWPIDRGEGNGRAADDWSGSTPIAINSSITISIMMAGSPIGSALPGFFGLISIAFFSSAFAWAISPFCS